MKLLITWYSTSKGGAEKSITDLSSGLAKINNEIILLYVSNYPTKIKSQLDASICLYQLQMPLWLYKCLCPFIMAFIYLKEKPDLVNHSFRCLREESFASWLLGIKRVSTVRAIVLDKKNANEYAKINHIIAISKAVGKQLKKIGYSGQIHLIYNGINMKQLKRFDLEKRNKNKIYFMARLVKWKRCDMFLRAAVKVKKILPKAEFYIFGDGPCKQSICDLIYEQKASKYIHYLGEVDVNLHLLEEMGIFVITSLAEPFGKTIVEAVMRGKVVVGSNSGAVPELLPYKGLLFKRDSDNDLVRKIVKANKNFNYYKRKFEKLAVDFEKKYDIKQTVNDYQKTFLHIYKQ